MYLKISWPHTTARFYIMDDFEIFVRIRGRTYYTIRSVYYQYKKTFILWIFSRYSHLLLVYPVHRMQEIFLHNNITSFTETSMLFPTYIGTEQTWLWVRIYIGLLHALLPLQIFLFVRAQRDYKDAYVVYGCQFVVGGAPVPFSQLPPRVHH